MPDTQTHLDATRGLNGAAGLPQQIDGANFESLVAPRISSIEMYKQLKNERMTVKSTIVIPPEMA